MSPSSNTRLQVSLISVLLLALTCARLTLASGVFELQFDRLQELSTENYITSSSETNNQESQQQRQQQRIVRVQVCLKEAFTSKLDGPCTFGNSSITLGRTTSVRLNSRNGAEQLTNQNSSSLSTNQQSTHQSADYQMTNLVRIPFTFRWTKAFTIILVVEELFLQENTQPPPPPPPPPHQQRITIKRYLALSGSKLARPPDELSTTGASLVGSEPTEEAPPSSSSQQHQPHQAPEEEKAMNEAHFIDRHVLTENEVLPNLETNPSKLWSSRFSRSLRSSIAYRFRVYCSLNYFGDGCTAFCRARDDHFGHYNCSTTGQKLCHEGWQGADCDKARCRQGCAGHCHKPDTCLCRPGWTGSRCDECLTYPGCGNGYCLSAWQCICHRNWGGQLCDQDLNYCGTHEPCKNNATCSNIAPGRYKCNCPDGFTGVDCDISVKSIVSSSDSGNSTKHHQGCSLNPCLNGGVCLEFKALEQQQPTTASNRLWPSTQSDTLDSDLQVPISDNLYRCQCTMGWFGDFCQWPDASYLALLDSTSNDTHYESTNQSHLSTNSPIINPSISEEFSDTFLNLPATTTNQPPAPPTFTEFPSHLIKITTQPNAVLELRHLISWILIASVIGVFLAALILAWCCLVAVERSKFSFIQMSFVRNTGASNQSTLQRFHNKIRDSLRLRSNNNHHHHNSKTKPEIKLNIENVLEPTTKPPPSYEESNCDASRTIRIEYSMKNNLDLCQPSFPNPDSSNRQVISLEEDNSGLDDVKDVDFEDVVSYITVPHEFKQDIVSKDILVIKEKPQLKVNNPPTKSDTAFFVAHAQLNCPRHGHFYRQQQHNHHYHQQQQQQDTLTRNLDDIHVDHA